MKRASFTRREALLALAAVTAAPRALAEITPPPPGSARYHVELVVFRQPGALPHAIAAPPLGGGATIAGRVQPLPESSWLLGGLAGQLGQHGYPVLAHSAWAAIVPPNGRTTAHTDDLLPGTSPIDGSVAVQRSQYLFVGIELDYHPGGASGPAFGLREKRRVKFGERHYFDHPAFGAILSVAAPHGTPGGTSTDE